MITQKEINEIYKEQIESQKHEGITTFILSSIFILIFSIAFFMGKGKGPIFATIFFLIFVVYIWGIKKMKEAKEQLKEFEEFENENKIKN